MDSLSDTSEGWTPSEAFERCRDPDLWTAEERARAELESARTEYKDLLGQARSWAHGWRRNDHRERSQYDRRRRYLQQHVLRSPEETFKAARAAVDRHFAELLRSGQLIAYGREDRPTNPPKCFPESMWSVKLALGVWRRRREPYSYRFGKKWIDVHGFRIYPPLKAPCAADLLNTLSMVEAFKRYVIGDPEVVAACASLRKTHAAVALQIERGWMGGEESPIWPVALRRTPHMWAWRGSLPESSIIGALSSDCDREGVQQFRPANGAFHDRLTELLECLRTGQIVAVGKLSLGRSEPIMRGWWARNDAWLDFRNGDLLEESKDGRIPVYKSLMLGPPVKEFEIAGRLGFDDLDELAEKMPKSLVQGGVTPPRESVAWFLEQTKRRKAGSKQDYWQKYHERWPSVSRRQFDIGVWPLAPASWKAPGRRPTRNGRSEKP